MIRSANLSPCGLYRWELRRVWGDADAANTLAICGANPSTADAQLDDPTIRRCIGFAKREGCDGLLMINVRGFRATNPDDVPALGPVEKAINGNILRRACGECPVIVCAWGTVADARAVGLAMDIFDDEMATLMCFGTTMQGHPKHPLYLAKATPLVPFGRRAA